MGAQSEVYGSTYQVSPEALLRRLAEVDLILAERLLFVTETDPLPALVL